MYLLVILDQIKEYGNHILIELNKTRFAKLTYLLFWEKYSWQVE